MFTHVTDIRHEQALPPSRRRTSASTYRPARTTRRPSGKHLVWPSAFLADWCDWRRQHAPDDTNLRRARILCQSNPV